MLISPVISFRSYALFTGWKANTSSTNSSHLPTNSWQPLNLHLHNLISVQPHRSTDRSSFLVTDVARPSTSSICLWNQLPSSLRQSHPSLSFSDLRVAAPNTSSHSVITTLTIHNSLTLSFPAQNVPLSQIFPTIDSSGLRTDSMDFITETFLLSIFFVFLKSFLHYSSCFWFRAQIKLAIRQHLGVQKYSYRVVSYRIVTYSVRTLITRVDGYPTGTRLK